MSRPPSHNSADPHNPQSADAASETIPCSPIAVLQWPWMRVKRDEEPENIYILTKRSNYKFHENIGLDRHSTALFASVCDTRAGDSFIRKSILPKAAWPRKQYIKTPKPVPDSNNRQVNICGAIDLFVEIGGRSKSFDLTLLSDWPKR